MSKNILILIISFFLIHISKAQTWSAVGAGLNGNVIALGVYNNELYAGGDFVTNGDGDTMNYIARWDGSKWTKVGNEIKSDTLSSGVFALTEYHGQLYAGGRFTIAGNTKTEFIARWNGIKWDSVGTPNMSNHLCFPTVVSGSINSLYVYNDELYVGGGFDMTGIPGGNIVRWNDTVWQSLGMGGVFNSTDCASVYDFTAFNSLLIITGYFESPCYGTATWDGSNWGCLGTGKYDDALAVYKSELYSGPYKWTGSYWQNIAGISWGIYDSKVYNNELYAGGSFSTIGGQSINKIARWNDTIWQAVGNGTNGDIFSMIVFNNDLYVGGRFTQADGNSANHIARLNITTNIKEMSNGHIATKVFQNPFSNSITIEISDLKFTKGEIIIYDVIGQQVEHQYLNSKLETLNLSLPSGIYFYKISKDNREIIGNGKLIIQ